MAVGTVITADIVNSTQLPKPAFQKLVKTIQSLMSSHKLEFYRGDSFQVYLKDNSAALELVLRTRLAARRIVNPGGPVDVRAVIGIGRVKSPVRSLRTSGEEPFILSGRLLDSMNLSVERLKINSFDERANCAFNVMARFMDYMVKSLTTKQAGVLFELFMGNNQTEIARKLKKSQVTINRQIHAADWEEINGILIQYRDTIEKFNLR